MVDVERLSRELMRALRGRRSQPAFSRLLGFRSNTVYSWESGRRQPEVSQFLRAALSGGRNARRKLAEFFELSEDALEGRRAYSTRTVMRLVQQLVGGRAKSALARELAVDRTTLGRWCLGKTEPRLPEFLRLVQLATQRLLQFVGLFVDPSKLESTREVHEHLLRQRRLAYDLPLSHAVLRALELGAYRKLARHSAAFLAAEVGLSEREVVRYLDELAATGQALRDGDHYSVAEILTIDTREDPEQNRRLKQFWAKEALERFESRRTGPEALFSFNLFAISESSYEKIRELHLAYYERLRAIIEQSQTADRVVLMNLQLVPLRAANEP